MLANGGWDLIQRLTLTLLALTKWRAPTNASKWRMGFNSAFKGLNSGGEHISRQKTYRLESITDQQHKSFLFRFLIYEKKRRHFYWPIVHQT